MAHDDHDPHDSDHREAQLAERVTRDSMIGTGLPKPAAGAAWTACMTWAACRSLGPFCASAINPIFMVLREPWKAQAFALVVQLHQRGGFRWTEWADALSREIHAVRARGEADTGANYYRHWLTALEQLLETKSVTNQELLAGRRAHLLAHWPSGHDHVAQRMPVAVA